MKKFLFPTNPKSIVTQTYPQHVARAKSNGWCYQSGSCPGGVYYFGGIDWGIPIRSPIIATHNSKVTTVKNEKTKGYGLRVELTDIYDSNWVTLYAHLDEVLVKVGDSVSAGKIIAYSGNTGNSTGPHLHFEVRCNNNPVDPAPMLVTTIAQYEASLDTTQPPVEPPVEPPVVFPEIPELPKAVCIATPWLRIRDLWDTSVDSKVIGRLDYGDEVEILEFIKETSDIWLRIGYNQYVAMYYDGTYFMRLL